MKFRYRTYNFSQNLLIITLLLYIVDFLFKSQLSSFFSLIPERVTNNLELWRLMTYPLVPGTIEGILLFIFTFWVIGSKLEIILDRIYFPIILILLTCLQGTILTLIFWKNTVSFSGMEGVSFFILTLFSFMQFSKKIAFWHFHPVRSVAFIFLLSITWFLSIFLHSMFAPKELFISGASMALFGISAGLVVFLQIRIIKGLRTLKQVEKEKTNPANPPDPMSLAYVSQSEVKKYNQKKFDESLYTDSEQYFTEDRLNEILDKINEKGKESLSQEELKYLKDYSEQV